LIDVFVELENADSDKIANIAITLSEWLEKMENLEDALNSLRQVFK
jgi:hypothetical protein